jgi:hypothetical protein
MGVSLSKEIRCRDVLVHKERQLSTVRGGLSTERLFGQAFAGDVNPLNLVMILVPMVGGSLAPARHDLPEAKRQVQPRHSRCT